MLGIPPTAEMIRKLRDNEIADLAGIMQRFELRAACGAVFG